MSRFAEKTTVSVEKSKAEIEQTLSRYGADQFGYAWVMQNAMVQFRMHGKMIKFILGLPPKDSDEFTKTNTGRVRTRSQVEKEWEQACRQRWRALALVIKAKLEAVECGITSFEEEFMAQIMMPDGSTFGKMALPAINSAYERGEMPTLMLENKV